VVCDGRRQSSARLFAGLVIKVRQYPQQLDVSELIETPLAALQGLAYQADQQTRLDFCINPAADRLEGKASLPSAMPCRRTHAVFEGMRAGDGVIVMITSLIGHPRQTSHGAEPFECAAELRLEHVRNKNWTCPASPCDELDPEPCNPVEQLGEGTPPETGGRNIGIGWPHHCQGSALTVHCSPPPSRATEHWDEITLEA
jgi:hypothetical protein